VTKSRPRKPPSWARARAIRCSSPPSRRSRAKHVARISVSAIRGQDHRVHRNPGFRSAHPGYACSCGAFECRVGMQSMPTNSRLPQRSMLLRNGRRGHAAHAHPTLLPVRLGLLCVEWKCGAEKFKYPMAYELKAVQCRISACKIRRNNDRSCRK
jgi:hypothetical protein